jgi:hypothetical protein
MSRPRAEQRNKPLIEGVEQMSSQHLIHNEPVRFTIFNTTDVPSGGWTYTDPDTGVRLNHININEVFKQATQLRVANRLGIPRMWPMVFQSLICEQNNLGEAFCKPFQSPKEKGKTRSLTVGDVRNFLAVLKEWMTTRADFVSQEEAERRASICAGCPQNVPASGCAGCTSIISLIASIVGRRKTSKDDGLLNCGICGCANQAQVHVPLDVLAKGITSDMAFPDNCWKKNSLNTDFSR